MAGTIEAKPIALSARDVARFWSKVELPGTNGCMRWAGALKPNGYGQFACGRAARYYPHRVAYTLTHGPIPQGLVIDHLCRNRVCVNPSHLEPVTQAENQHRGVTAAVTTARHAVSREGRTHCANGHAMTPENTRVRRRKGCADAFRCATCDREAWRKYDAKRRSN